MRRKTDGEFKQEVYDLVGDEYTFLDSYKGSLTKIKVRHNKCGNVYRVVPSDFLRGSRCPKCSGRVKKTNAKFIQEVYGLVGNEYSFLEHYQGDHVKIKVKHNKCGNTYEVSPHSFLQGRRCPYCKGGIKKTDKQFKQEVYDLVGNEYIFMEPYVNSATKISVKHNKCGHTYEVTPNSFLRGSRCPYCNNSIKRTDEQFKQEVYDLVGDEYTFLDSYVNNHAKLRVKHNRCGNTYETTPHSFLQGHRCPYCAGNLIKNSNWFANKVTELSHGDYQLIGDYVNSKTKVKVRHNKCGNTYEVTPNNFITGYRCPYCGNEDRIKTDGEFKQEVYGLVGNEYSFLERYQKADNKIRVKHNKCGNIYKVKPAMFLIGSRCPYCNSPKGELMIDKILKSLDINYEAQKTFDDLKDKSYLSYDFYIPDQNVLIEYQGRQHYQPIEYFGGETRFKNQQKHDKLKSDYAKKHGYNLIAVPYTEDTFSKIKKYLIKHGLTK